MPIDKEYMYMQLLNSTTIESDRKSWVKIDLCVGSDIAKAMDV